jgi:hypothetical protein
LARWHCYWQEDAAGDRRIRAECSFCGRFLTFLAEVTEYVELANAAARQTDLLDALTRLDALGVELHSDGRRVWIGGGDSRRVPADLAALVRQCGHRLARLMGKRG